MHTGELLHLAAVAEGVDAHGMLQFSNLEHTGDSTVHKAIRVTDNFGTLVRVARDLCVLCTQQVQHSLDSGRGMEDYSSPAVSMFWM
jgi:hypothetical protein